MGFQLTIAEGKEAGREFVFEQASVAIGRSSDCDVVLYDPGVSRRHARIFAEGDAYLVEDLGSSNGTKVNGQQIKRQKLAEGDAITLGPVVFEFVGTFLEDETPAAELGADGVASQSTRIVSVDSVKRQKNKGAALAPSGVGETDLQAMRRSPTRAMQAISRPRSSGSSNSLAKAEKKGPEAPLARPVRRTPPGGAAALSAVERARIRRESPGMVGNLKVFWLEASQTTRRGLFAALGVVALALVALLYWVVLGESATLDDRGPEPTVLSRKKIKESFGYGAVDFERSDLKAFEFEFVSPTRALAILTYQAQDIAQDEVSITVNGHEVARVPPDTIASADRVLEVLVSPEVLKKGERNEVIFDNMKNPPGDETWKVWNLRVETIPLPEIPIDQLISEAKAAFERGVRNLERRDIGAQNRYEAWKDFRNAWLLLEGHPDPKPELYDLARAKVRESQQELDRTCAKLMLEVEKHYNQRDWDAASGTLEHVKQYFPNPNDQICPAKAERKRWEYEL